MASQNSELVISTPGGVRKQRRLGNTIVFPKELRDAIPVHSGRVLEFDRVTGAVNRSWINFNAEWLRVAGYEVTGARAQVSLLAHETGQFNGQFEIGLDLDTKTMRALGEFLIQLADKADGEAT